MSYKCFSLPISLEMWDSIGLSLKDIDEYMGEETLLFGIFHIAHGHILSAIGIFNSKTITHNFSKTRDITIHLEKAESDIILKKEGYVSDEYDELMDQIWECQIRVRMYDQYCIDDIIQNKIQNYKTKVSVLDVEGGPSVENSLLKLRTCFESSDNEE